MSLCALGLKQLLISLLFNHTALILGVYALRRYLKLICEYELHNLSNKKLRPQRIMVKATSRSDRPWSAIFCVIVYCDMPVLYRIVLHSSSILENEQINSGRALFSYRARLTLFEFSDCRGEERSEAKFFCAV